MVFAPKTRVRPVRLALERLEDRLQLSAASAFDDLSLLGDDLFDRDPLTGRRNDPVSDASLLATLAANSSSQAYGDDAQQVQVAPQTVRQNTSNLTLAQTATQQLLQAAGMVASQTVDLQNPDVLQAPTPVPLQGVDTRAEPTTPIELQLLQQTVGGEPIVGDPSIQVGTDFGTGYNGVAGNDVGNAAAFWWTDPLFQRGVGFYAGYTQRVSAGNPTGNRDIMVWAIDHYISFGTVRLWEVVISANAANPGADEALGIDVSPDGREVFITGYVTQAAATGEDLFVSRLNALTGAPINTVVIGGAGNQRGTDVRAFQFLSPAFISVTGVVPGTAPVNTRMYNSLMTNALVAAYSNSYAFTGINDQSGDAVALNYSGESLIAGTIVQAGNDRPLFAKIDAAGTFIFAGAFTTLVGRGGGIDFDILGGNSFWMTGEADAAGPPVHRRMLIARFTDNGATATQLWGNLVTFDFGNPPVPGNLAGNYVRATYNGDTYIICELWGPGVNRNTGNNNAIIVKWAAAGGALVDSYLFSVTPGQLAQGNDKGFGLAFTGGLGVVVAGKAQHRPAPNGFPVCSFVVYQCAHGDAPAQNLDDAFWSWVLI